MPKTQTQVWMWQASSTPTDGGTSANETSSSSTDEGASANPTATNCKASYTPPTNAEAMYTEM